VRVRLTEQERRRRGEVKFLANLTETALNAADHLELMRQVCTAAVPTLGDWCSLYFVPATGGPPLVAFAHVDPDKIDFVEELQRRYPYDPAGVTGVPAVIRDGGRPARPHGQLWQLVRTAHPPPRAGHAEFRAGCRSRNRRRLRPHWADGVRVDGGAGSGGQFVEPAET
jgi:hypothetical protein